MIRGALVASATYGLAVYLGRRILSSRDYGSVGPSFVSVTTIFSFPLAFHASEVWLHKAAARSDAVQLGLNIQRLTDLWGPQELKLNEASVVLSEYVAAVIREGWGNGNLKESPEARAKWKQLRRMIQALSEGRDLGRSQLVMAEIEQLRAKKFLVATTSSGCVLFVLGTLGALSHLSIACVHWDRPKSMAVALGIFAVATSLVYCLVAVDEFTYRSPEQFGIGTSEVFTRRPAENRSRGFRAAFLHFPNDARGITNVPCPPRGYR